MTPNLVYAGSVKNVWESDTEHLEFEYTDAYSVFDWGRMPDLLQAKGTSLAILGDYFFRAMADPSSWTRAGKSESVRGSTQTQSEYWRWLEPVVSDPLWSAGLRVELEDLATRGLFHHCVELRLPNRLVVRKLSVVPPQAYAIGRQTLYDYSPCARDDANANFASTPYQQPSRLIPLEVVFRLGMPSGSSLVERLTPEYARQLGLNALPKPNVRFERPIVEFFSKLEANDRYFTYEQALNYSGLSFVQFQSVVNRTLLVAAWLAGLFESHGLELWDGKLEWGLIDGRVALVDSIGPDELRLIDPESGMPISKEFLRAYYRDTPWAKAVKMAKKEAQSNPNINWKSLVMDRIGAPPALNAEFKAAADALYPSLAATITGINIGDLDLSMKETLKRMGQCLKP